MANRFLNNITINDQYTLPSTDGSAGQILSTTGAADGTTELQFINQGDVVAGEADKALSLTLRVKNTESVALTKGQVVCAAPSATPPSGNVIEVKRADNNGTDSMPAIGILNEGLDAAGGANDEGEAIMFGRISGIDTSAFSVGDEVFVSDTPGGLTTTKPTGVKYIQKVGVVIRDDANNGTIEVFGAGRTNDVPTPLYIDHANQRLGIGVENPAVNFQVGDGTTDTTSRFYHDDNTYTEINGYGLYMSRNYSYIRPTTDNTKALAIGTNTKQWNILSIDASTTTFNTNGSANMRITSSGNVGIGTTNPSTKLHVSDGRITIDQPNVADNSDNWSIKLIENSGTCYIGNHNGIAQIQAGGYLPNATGTTIQLDADTQTYAGIWASEQGKIHLVTAYSATAGGTPNYEVGFTMNNDGNVGIGTSSPSQKLDVSGNIKMTETAATTDTDKFVVLDSGVLKYRTGAQIISDLPTDSRYVAVTGDTMTGDLNIGANLSLTGDSRILNLAGGSTTSSQSRVIIGEQGTYGVSFRWNSSAELEFDGFWNSSVTGSRNRDLGSIDVNNRVWYLNNNVTVGNDLTVSGGDIILSGTGRIQGIDTVSAGTDAVNKNYVDNNFASSSHTHSEYLLNNAFDEGVGLYLTAGSYNAGIDTATTPLVIDEGDFIKTKDGDYLRNLIGKTTGDEIQIGQGGTGLIDSINFLPGVGGNSAVKVNGNTVWNAGNDGSGSGLDADLLDGQHASAFLTSLPSHNHDSLYVNVTGDTMTGGLTVPNITIADGIYHQGDTNNYFQFGTDTQKFITSGVERMRITSGGNVGIGDTNPDATLTVYRTSTTFATALSTAESRAGLTVKSTSTYDAKLTISTGTSGVQQIQGVNNAATTGRDISINPYGGNVGIGTTNPGKTLHVSGNDQQTARIRLSNTNTASGGDNIDLVAGIHNVGQDGFSIYNATSNQTQFVILGSGNVGIGTTSPGAKLHVSSGTANEDCVVIIESDTDNNDETSNPRLELRQDGGAVIGRLGYRDNTNSLELINEYAEHLYLGTNNTTDLTILNNGNVGIGTTSPAAKLDLNGASVLRGLVNVTTTGEMLRLNDTSSTGSPYMTFYQNGTRRSFIQHNDSSDTFIIASEYGPIDLKTASNSSESTRMRISAVGDVGIGQTNPTVKLDVVDVNASRTWSHYFATVAAFERNGDSIVNIVSGNTGNASIWFGRSNAMVRGRIRYEQGNDKMELWTGNAPKVYIDSSGNLHATADVVAYSSSVSDIRLKDNINTIDSALDKVKKLRGVEYTWNAGSRKDKKDLGVIAQEVEEVLPEIVHEHKMDFIDEQIYKTVDYEKITAVLIEAIKEQQKQIDELTAIINGNSK